MMRLEEGDRKHGTHPGHGRIMRKRVEGEWEADLTCEGDPSKEDEGIETWKRPLLEPTAAQTAHNTPLIPGPGLHAPRLPFLFRHPHAEVLQPEA